MDDHFDELRSLSAADAGGGMTRHLLVSVHDVAPRFEGEVDRLLDLIGETVGQSRVTMLVVPRHWNSEPIRPGSPFAARIRDWSQQGVEMFAHGWTHRDDSRHVGLAAFKARHMTASEGEFLGLSEGEALLRMQQGKALIEDIIGAPVRGFVAPAWLYSEGARHALGEAGFELAEDHMRVWAPMEEDRRLAGGPVITWASRSRSRRASSLAAALVLRRALRRCRVARVGLHPGDTRHESLLASIRATLKALSATHTPANYVDLLSK